MQTTAVSNSVSPAFYQINFVPESKYDAPTVRCKKMTLNCFNFVKVDDRQKGHFLQKHVFEKIQKLQLFSDSEQKMPGVITTDFYVSRGTFSGRNS